MSRKYKDAFNSDAIVNVIRMKWTKPTLKDA